MGLTRFIKIIKKKKAHQEKGTLKKRHANNKTHQKTKKAHQKNKKRRHKWLNIGPNSKDFSTIGFAIQRRFQKCSRIYQLIADLA